MNSLGFLCHTPMASFSLSSPGPTFSSYGYLGYIVNSISFYLLGRARGNKAILLESQVSR